MSEFRVTGRASLDGSGFMATIGQMDIGVKRLARDIGREVSGKVQNLFTLGAAEEGIRRTIEFAKHMTNLAIRTGVSVEELQRLDRAARANGATIEDIIGFWEKLESARDAALANPTGRQAHGLAALGVGAGDLNKTADDLMRKIAVRFQSTDNIEQLIAPLRAIGGRGVGNLVAVFRSGLDQMYKDALVMTGETAEQLRELGEKGENLWLDIMSGLAPVLNFIVDWLRRIIFTGRAFFTELFTGSTQAAIDSLKTDFDQFDKEKAEIKKRVEERKTRRTGLGFEAFNIPEEKISGQKIASDALTAVGNFLGSSRDPLARIANQQLDYLRMIERNTRTTTDRDALGIDGAD